MHDINKDIELSKYRYSLAKQTYNSARRNRLITVRKCVLIMGFTEIVLIARIMRCFMQYELCWR